MSDDFPNLRAFEFEIDLDGDVPDLEPMLWSALVALRHQRGVDATWALIAKFMPKKAANRPHDPDGEIARRLRLTYELRERTWRATGKQLSLTAAAKQIDKEYNPRATENTWQSIVRAHKLMLKLRRQVLAGQSMRAHKHEHHRDEDIFFGLSRLK